MTTTKIVAALSLAFALAIAAPIAHAEPSQARQAAAAKRCRDASGHFSKCGSNAPGTHGLACRHAPKGNSGKLVPAAPPVRQADAAAHVRTTRCDGKGPLVRPTSRPCKRANLVSLIEGAKYQA